MSSAQRLAAAVIEALNVDDDDADFGSTIIQRAGYVQGCLQRIADGDPAAIAPGTAALRRAAEKFPAREQEASR